MISSKSYLTPYLDLSFRAGLTADGADHVTAIHPQLVVIDA